MSLTLSLSTALSGLLTSQQNLNVISQNVVNANTEGYTRKTMSPESRVLGGFGAGIQATLLQRSVDEYLLRDMRRETSRLEYLNEMDSGYTRIEHMVGEVGSDTSVSNLIQGLSDSLTALAQGASRTDAQWAVSQAGVNIAERLRSTTTQLTSLRGEVDREIQDVISDVNAQLENIASLNATIVRNGAVGLDVTDLQDKRDIALNKLSKNMDIRTNARNDGSVAVFASAGDVLVDGSAVTLRHTAVTASPWMSLAGGQFDTITADGSDDLTGSFTSGSMKALIDLRDTVIPNLQAQLDELTLTMKNTMNLAHNSGTSLPNVQSDYTGTRTFADQDNITQRISLTGTEDTALILYDSDGVTQAQTTLRALMDGTAFSPAAATLAQPWSIDNIGIRMEDWLQDQNYSNSSLANAGLDSDGHFAISTGNTGYGLAFRDQVDSGVGSAITDISISFDVDSATAGTADETASGFSNFLGLNDFFVTNAERHIVDSGVLSASTTLSVARDLTLYDATGKLGNTISVTAGASLSDIAAAINTQTKVMESVELSTSVSISGTSANTISITDADNGTVQSTYTILAGVTSVSLATIAAGLNGQNGISATVVEDRGGSRLRITDSSGRELDVTYSGDDEDRLRDSLELRPTSRLNAAVVPDGAGMRLRIVQANGDEIFMTSTTDGAGTNMLTDLKLAHAATGIAGELDVRVDLQSAPAKISRGTVQWNSDSQSYFISSGDNAAVNRMATAFQSKVSLKTAGDIHGSQFTLTEYASATISITARQAANVQERQDYQKGLTDELTFRHRSESGVNIDEEVSNMIQFQQSYAAAARMISTIKEMLDTLMDAVR
jgi:flagellar hook-associated protein 1 FlgK